MRDRVQLDVRQRDDEVGSEEDVELGRVEPLHSLVVEGEVEDDEEVVGVLVDLRALPLGENVLDVELVEAEPLGEDGGLRGPRLVDLKPGEAFSGELGDARFDALGDLPGRASGPSPDTGQGRPWHRYSGDRRSASPST
jgi:hypothetical protein